MIGAAHGARLPAPGPPIPTGRMPTPTCPRGAPRSLDRMQGGRLDHLGVDLRTAPVGDAGAVHTCGVVWQPTQDGRPVGGTPYTEHRRIPDPQRPDPMIALRLARDP